MSESDNILGLYLLLQIASEKPSVTNVYSTVESIKCKDSQVICCAPTMHNFLNVLGNEILLWARGPFSLTSRSHYGAK